MIHQTVQVLMFSAIILLLSSSAILTGAQPHEAVPTPPPPGLPDQPGCNQIVNELTPCLQYVRGKEPQPSKACCDGAKQLSEQAKTKQDKQTACECIKRVLTTLPDVDTSRINNVPQACGISYNLPPIDRNFDCST